MRVMEPTNFNEDLELLPLVASSEGDNHWEEQLRDPGGEHGGWWIEMGGLNLFKFMDSSGSVKTGTAKYVGLSREKAGFGRFLVIGVEGLKDGIYHLDPANIDPIKAYLPQSLLTKLGIPTDNLPFNKNTLVDLSNTLVTPITQQDLDRAEIEPEKRVDSRGLAEDREKTATTYGQLKPGDVVYDENNDVYGHVMSSSTENDKTSLQIKWENNRVDQVDGEDASKPISVWAKPEEAKSEERKSAVKVPTEVAASTLKKGDVLVFNGVEYTIASVTPRAQPGTKEVVGNVVSFKPSADGSQFPDLSFASDDVVEILKAAPAVVKTPAADTVKTSNEIKPGETKQHGFSPSFGDEIVTGNVIRHDGQNVIVMEVKTLSDKEQTPEAKHIVTAQDESGNVIQFSVPPKGSVPLLKNRRGNRSPVDQTSSLKVKPASTTTDTKDATEAEKTAAKIAELKSQYDRVSAEITRLLGIKERLGGRLGEDNQKKLDQLQRIKNIIPKQIRDLSEKKDEEPKDSLAAAQAIIDGVSGLFIPAGFNASDRITVTKDDEGNYTATYDEELSNLIKKYRDNPENKTALRNAKNSFFDLIRNEKDPKKLEGLIEKYIDFLGEYSKATEFYLSSIGEGVDWNSINQSGFEALYIGLLERESVSFSEEIPNGSQLKKALQDKADALLKKRSDSSASSTADTTANTATTTTTTTPPLNLETAQPGDKYVIGDGLGVKILPDGKILLYKNSFPYKDIIKSVAAEISRKAGGYAFVLFNDPKKPKAKYPDDPYGWIIQITPKTRTLEKITVDLINKLDEEVNKDRTVSSETEGDISGNANTSGDLGGGNSYSISDSGVITINPASGDASEAIYELYYGANIPGVLALDSAGGPTDPITVQMDNNTPEARSDALKAISQALGEDGSTTNGTIPPGYENIGTVYGNKLKVGDIVNGKTIAEIGPTENMDSMLYRVFTFTDGTVSNSIADADSFKDVLRKKATDKPEVQTKAYWDWVKEQIKNKKISDEDLKEALTFAFTPLIKKDEDGSSDIVKKALTELFKENPEATRDEAVSSVLSSLKDFSSVSNFRENYKNVFEGVFDSKAFKEVEDFALEQVKKAYTYSIDSIINEFIGDKFIKNGEIVKSIIKELGDEFSKLAIKLIDGKPKNKKEVEETFKKYNEYIPRIASLILEKLKARFDYQNSIGDKEAQSNYDSGLAELLKTLNEPLDLVANRNQYKELVGEEQLQELIKTTKNVVVTATDSSISAPTSEYVISNKDVSAMTSEELAAEAKELNKTIQDINKAARKNPRGEFTPKQAAQKAALQARNTQIIDETQRRSDAAYAQLVAENAAKAAAEADKIASTIKVGDSTDNDLVLDRLPVGTILGISGGNQRIKKDDGQWHGYNISEVEEAVTPPLSSAKMVEGIFFGGYDWRDGGTQEGAKVSWTIAFLPTSTTETALTPEKRAELEAESDLLVDQGVNMGLIKRGTKEDTRQFRDRINKLKSEARGLDDSALQELVNNRKNRIKEVAVRDDNLPVNPNLTGFQNASIHRRINEGRYPGILSDERIKEINDSFMDIKYSDVGILIRELDAAELNWRVKNGWSINKLKERWTDSRTGQPVFPSPEIANIVNNYVPTKDEDGKPLSTTTTNVATTTTTANVVSTTETVTTPTGPTVEELLANSEAKKVSDINIGDRVYDTASESFAVVIGVAESQMAKGKIELTIRYANGEEATIGLPKSRELLVYKEPKTEDAETDTKDSDEIVTENADDGSVDVTSTVSPVSNPARRGGPGKLTRINLSGYSKEEKRLIIEFFMAYEELRRTQEEVEGRPYVPKHYIDPSDIPEDILISEDKIISKANKYAGRVTIGTPLGMRLSEASMDAVDPITGYTVYQPTPGAFTGAAAKAFEGKKLSEIRDLFREMEVYAFDTETTGIARFDGDPTNNKPVQVGIVKSKNGEILDRLNIYVNPGIEDGVRLGKWSAENLVHDILDKDGNPIIGEDGKPKTEKVTNDWLSKQMSMAEAARVVTEFMGDSPMVVGQNVPFDLEILQQLLDAAQIKDYSIGGTIDSKDLGSYLLPKYDPEKGIDGPKRLDSKTGKYIPSSSLGYLAEFLGFETTRWHSADGDAEDSLKLALAILDRAAEERPNEVNVLANKAEMGSTYDKKLAKFLAATHPDNPSTAKQHGAVVRDGFAEVLDDFGIPEKIKNAILEHVREMSRGQAAAFIRSFIENAESARRPSPIAGAPKQKVVSLPAITDKIKRRGRKDLRSQVRFVDKSEEKTTPSNPETRLSEPQNTSSEFKNAVVLTGPALETFENATNDHPRGPWLKPTPNEAGYIPSKKNKVAYEKAYQDYLVRTPGLEELSDAESRALFDRLIQNERKDKRPHVVARVGTTNAYVRWRPGDASNETIQATIDHLQELDDFSGVDGVPVVVTITKPGTFTVDKLFTNQEDSLGGSTFVTPFGVFISINPELFGVKDWATKPGRLGGNDSYVTTLTHEYAHGIARVILGNMLKGVGKHHPRFEEFIRLFPELGDDHPISEYGGESYGESFAEYFREAFWYIANKLELPPKTDRLNNFMQWYEKVKVSSRVMDMADVKLRSEERQIGGLTFPPMADTIGGDAAYEQEFVKRAEFYQNGLTPTQAPLTPEHASIIKDYYAVVKADGEGYYKTGSKEARDNYVNGIKVLKSFYDSLFFGYAKQTPKNTLKSVASRLTRNKDQYRSWTSDTSFLGIALGPGNYRNEIIPGEYTNNDGTVYPIVTIKSALGATEASVTYALDPSYSGKEINYSGLTLADIKSMSVAKLQADNLDQEDKSLEILDLIVDNSYRRQGIATAMLQSARSSTKNKIIHPEYPAGDGKAWASSIESDEENLSATFKKFNDIYGIATQRGDGKDITSPNLKPTDVDLAKINLDKEETYYAGLTYGEEYNPILRDYTNPLGGLGQYRSVVGYVSVQALQQMRGNDVRSKKNLQKKIDNFTSGRGLKEPITVFYDPDRGVAYVADGNHRVEAADQAGVSHVPVIVQISKIGEDENTKPVDAANGIATFSETGWPKNVHPYYVFKRENLINSDNITSPAISEEMISNVALWTSKVETENIDQPNFTPDPNNVLEKSPPGSYVLDTKTGRVGKVYGYETIEVITDQGPVARNTGNIIVRFLDGIVDNMEEYRFSTTLEFNSAGKRTIPEGASSEGGYNDYRIYTDEIRNPEEFDNITDQFMKLSDQPIMILDSMYVIQRETGIKGRISGFPMPGYVEISYLTGENDEDGLPIYNTTEAPVSEISPIQNQRHVAPEEGVIVHADDMLPTKAQWDEINRYSNALYTWGYLSKEQYNAIQIALHGKFITRSGADRLRVELENFNLYRVHKVRTGGRSRTNARGPVVFEEREETPTAVTPVAPAETPEKFDIEKVRGKMGFLDLLNRFKAEKAAVSEERRVATVTKSEVTTNPPTPSQIDEVERGLTEDGALSEERAAQILSVLPMLDGKSILPIIDEVNTAVLNKRIVNDEPISDINVPDSYNISKLEGYAPSEERIVESEATDEEIGEMDENGIDPEDAIEFTPEQNQILDHAQHTNETFAVLAVAGTGKSTLERRMLKRLRKMGKSTIVVAPTGVASLNAKGQTIHQQFKFPLGLLGNKNAEELTKKYSDKDKELFRGLSTLIIDEVSMVNPDVMDAMDRVLRYTRGKMNEPFGGVQVIMFGDPLQLAPVPYDDAVADNYMKETYQTYHFFSANVWAADPLQITSLTKILRQDEKTDPQFVEALNAIRVGEQTPEMLSYLWKTSQDNREREEPGIHTPNLVPTNKRADAINAANLEALPGPVKTFIGSYEGPDAERIFRESSTGVPPKELNLKIGAPVMFVMNDNNSLRKAAGVKSKKRRWVNGDVGVVAGQTKGDSGVLIIVEMKDGTRHMVPQAVWEHVSYAKNRRVDENRLKKEEITDETDASYTQYPLKLSWAITIHKSQGQTYDSVNIDYSEGGGFAEGQTYVALSRLRSSKGLYLTVPIRKGDIKVDRSVLDFLERTNQMGLISLSEERSVAPKFDPLLGYESAAELDSAIEKNKVRGPNGESLTTYQQRALDYYLTKIRENPNSADMYRQKIAELYGSWFGQDDKNKEESKIVEVDANGFKNAAERQALIDLLNSNGIPYKLKY